MTGLDAKERFDCVNEARKTLAQILGGAVLLAGFFGTWQNIKVAQKSLTVSQESMLTSQKALDVSREGQITDRITKAIEQLGAVGVTGNKKLEVRVGGTYALERIANDSKRDHWPVMEVLCTYVRVNAAVKQENPPGKERKPRKSTPACQASTAPNPAADIQAILTVLGRRDHTYEQENLVLDLRSTILAGVELIGANLNYADLRRTDLSFAKLNGAHLIGVNLRGAILREADLRGAILTGATLSEADVSCAYLSEANLSGAALNGAHLNGASLYKADLRDADVNSADLSGALVHGADLRTARNVTQQQIDAAKGDPNTLLPDNIHMPESWK